MARPRVVGVLVTSLGTSDLFGWKGVAASTGGVDPDSHTAIAPPVWVLFCPPIFPLASRKRRPLGFLVVGDECCVGETVGAAGADADPRGVLGQGGDLPRAPRSRIKVALFALACFAHELCREYRLLDVLLPVRAIGQSGVPEGKGFDALSPIGVSTYMWRDSMWMVSLY
jgi:hypothetical protein